jgi:hypothetical protein
MGAALETRRRTMPCHSSWNADRTRLSELPRVNAQTCRIEKPLRQASGILVRNYDLNGADMQTLPGQRTLDPLKHATRSTRTRTVRTYIQVELQAERHLRFRKFSKVASAPDTSRHECVGVREATPRNQRGMEF